jgi:hypothetical protein
MEKKKLSVEKGLAANLEAAVAAPPEDLGLFCKRGEVLFDEGVVFEDNLYMIIQVVASETPSMEECWTQGVLFSKEGHEIGATDVGESFAGEYHVWDGDKEYVVDVVPK